MSKITELERWCYDNIPHYGLMDGVAKHKLRDALRVFKQSPEPEQQQHDDIHVPMEAYVKKSTKYNLVKVDEQPSSESERENIYNIIDENVIGQYDTIMSESLNKNVVRLLGVEDAAEKITDFILSREKEKDAEIERLKESIAIKHNNYMTAMNGIEKLFENERLKGERGASSLERSGGAVYSIMGCRSFKI